jgi:hypothetical protein
MQLYGEDELQRRERRNLIDEALDGDLNQGLGVLGLLSHEPDKAS